PLRREIITTRVVNDVVNFGGTTFLFRFWEETGASTADIVRAYLVTREVFDLPGVVRQIQALDNKVDTATQLAMLFEARKLSERGTGGCSSTGGSRWSSCRRPSSSPRAPGSCSAFCRRRSSAWASPRTRSGGTISSRAGCRRTLQCAS